MAVKKVTAKNDEKKPAGKGGASKKDAPQTKSMKSSSSSDSDSTDSKFGGGKGSI